MATWEGLLGKPVIPLHTMLSLFKSLDEFLARSPKLLMYWFFQRREVFMSQKRFPKWSRENLDDYVLLPAATGYVLRRDCFFVSHFWRTKEDPDPEGETLRLHQAELEPQEWSYIWVDWVCLPQHPRSPSEEVYFNRGLWTMSGIIRNSGFIYFYPPFKPRLWILYEITEFCLTCDAGLDETSDIKPFLLHLDEMIVNGVQETVVKYNYECSDDRDRRKLISWMELLVLLKRLGIDVGFIRTIMDNTTWHDVQYSQMYPPVLELYRYEGFLLFLGKRYTFTPFLKRVSAISTISIQCAKADLLL